MSDLHAVEIDTTAPAGDSECTAGTIQPIRLKPFPEMPLVSVLCSNYNYGNFIGRAIQSVLDQTYPHFELIICDDGSSDDSCAASQPYLERDRRIRLIRKGNGGQASGYNAAYRQSGGDVICLLDSDDVYNTRKLEKVIEAFRSRPESGFVGHRLLRVDEHGNPEGIAPLFGQMPSGWQAPRMLRNAGFLEYLAPGGGLSVRRAVADRIFPLPEHRPMRDCGDAPFMLLAPLMTPLIAVNEVLAEWRRHGGNRSNRSSIDAGYLARELDVYKHHWRLQQSYLARYHPDAVNCLASLDTNCHVASLKYALARLQGQQVLASYRSMVHCWRARAKRNRSLGIFWIISILMPRRIFAPAFTYLVTPNSLKRLCVRIAHGRKGVCKGDRRSGNESPDTCGRGWFSPGRRNRG
jgi:glycosyltransferase involved in cell wall biosynthesis